MHRLSDYLPSMVEDAECAIHHKRIGEYHRIQEDFAVSSDAMMEDLLRNDVWIPSWNRATPVDTKLGMEIASDNPSSTDNLALTLIFRNHMDSKGMHNIVTFLSGFDNIYMAGLARLPPGATVSPHRDLAADMKWEHGGKCMRICNIALITNDKCTLECNGVVHTHKVGEWVDFDPRQIHYARNDGHSERIILAFNYVTDYDGDDSTHVGRVNNQ